MMGIAFELLTFDGDDKAKVTVDILSKDEKESNERTFYLKKNSDSKWQIVMGK